MYYIYINLYIYWERDIMDVKGHWISLYLFPTLQYPILIKVPSLVITSGSLAAICMTSIKRIYTVYGIEKGSMPPWLDHGITDTTLGWENKAVLLDLLAVCKLFLVSLLTCREKKKMHSPDQYLNIRCHDVLICSSKEITSRAAGEIEVTTRLSLQ